MGLVYRARGKRLLDIGAAVLGLIITASVAAVVFAAIRLADGGPLIFTRERIGRNERHFRIHTFRSLPVSNP